MSNTPSLNEWQKQVDRLQFALDKLERERDAACLEHKIVCGKLTTERNYQQTLQQERDQLRAVADELAHAVKNISECHTCLEAWSEALTHYNSLPHVKKRNEK